MLDFPGQRVPGCHRTTEWPTGCISSTAGARPAPARVEGRRKSCAQSLRPGYGVRRLLVHGCRGEQDLGSVLRRTLAFPCGEQHCRQDRREEPVACRCALRRSCTQSSPLFGIPDLARSRRSAWAPPLRKRGSFLPPENKTKTLRRTWHLYSLERRHRQFGCRSALWSSRAGCATRLPGCVDLSDPPALTWDSALGQRELRGRSVAAKR
mmetsp:Transcript_40888/g.131501  ORF Transcript_40888/g.131501 Transcript_40888/m.131501 type:complete len:209 (-) Transcript_40888:65-691(-)